MIVSETSTIQILILILTSLTSILTLLQFYYTYKRIDNKKKTRLSPLILNHKKNNHIFDPHETKLLNAIIKGGKFGGIDINEFNTIQNLSKLSTENQRLRRHIILKELNLKLFLLTGIRKSITTIPAHLDKRVKFYNFIPEVLDLDLIRKFLPEKK